MLDRSFLAPHALARWAAETPDGIAVEHTNGDSLSFSTLLRQSLEFATALQRLGVERGTHVGTMLPNVFDAHRTLLAIGWLRGVEVPLNTAYVGSLLEYAINLSDITILVATAEFAERLREIAPRLTTLQTVVIIDDGPLAPLPFRTVERGGIPGGGGTRRGARRAGIFGHCGPPLHVRHHRSFEGGHHTVGRRPPILVLPPRGSHRHGEGLYCPLPLFHNSGRAAFNFTLVHGARLIMRDKFSATHVWDDVRRCDAKVLALVGPLTSLVYSAPEREDDADNPVRTVVCGPMIPEIEEFEKRFDVNVLTCYGQSETGIPLATGWDHGPWDNCGRPRLDYPWTEVRVVNDMDEPVGPGVVGELVVRSAEPWSLNVGYYKMPAQTAEAWRNGWFHTGDAFRYDEDGWYYFADRMSDTIRRRGENISSYEVEMMVSEYPDVVECAAIGVRTAHGDDECLVHVLVADPATFDPAELIRFLLPRMPRYMVPRYVEVVDGDLPRNETSMRVRKSVLRERGLSARSWDREAPVTS